MITLRRELVGRVPGGKSQIRGLCGALLAFLLLAGCGGERARVEREKARLQAYILDVSPSIANRLDIDFDGKVMLLGYAVLPQKVRPGQPVHLTLYWQSKADIAEGWTLFTRLLDSSGEQIDNLDGQGPLRAWVRKGEKQTLGPDAWERGKIYVDELVFTLPLDTNTENVQIVAGVKNGDARLVPRSGTHDAHSNSAVVTLDVELVRKEPPVQTPPPVPFLRVLKLPAGAAIKLDGQLTEPQWQSAAATPSFVDPASGLPNPRLPVSATAKVLWDDAGFYLGCNVATGNIVGGFKPGLADQHLWTEDAVEVLIDPDGDGDNRDYYEIQVNPQNLVFDSQFDAYNVPRDEKAGTFGHQGWSSHLKSAVRVDGTLHIATDQDRGYTVEMFVPWKSFALAKVRPPHSGDVWRMNIYAVKQNAGVAWSAIMGQGNFHTAGRFGRILWIDPSLEEASRSGSNQGGAPGVQAIQRNAAANLARLRSSLSQGSRAERVLELQRTLK
ncbi:MAG: carbohydrate-binding family 9-like protein [Polyangiaceae bacterium]|nr:carbohydrate-binding family 9-like protein [Polyangiaceae bacterium]